ncbi:hypothetical protein BC830DRAFT_260094 [Chytriomyces sp. MP71]|nr:hypothetical protein BC830DRAFT_260094 [Chytriomyces sp. MP71]
MLDFQARLIVKYNIVMPSRILKKNGPIDYINKRGDRKRCELYLFNDVLVLAKPSSNDQLKMMALVPFDMILVNCPNPANVDIKLGRSIGKDLHLIEIVHVNCAKFYLALESVTAKSSWVKALQEATEEWISGKQRMCAMVAAQSYSGSPGMISAPIGVEVVSAKMVEKPEVAESQVAVRRLLPSVPTVEAALKQEVRAKPPSSGSPRRNVQAPVPIGNLAIDAAISVAKLREEKLNAAISNDSLSETEDNRSLVQKAMPPLLVTKKVRNGSPSDGASHFGESGDEMALSSIRHQSGSYQLKSHEKLESLSELSLQRTKLKPVEHFSDNGSQESVAVSNQSLIANANTDATEPTKLISSSRLALNNFIVQDHSRLNSQHPAVSVHPKMTMIPHSSSMSDTHNVKAMATTPPVTQSMPGFRTSCDSKESLAGSLGNVHEAKSSIASLPVAVHNSALAQSNNSLQSLNLPPKNVSDSLISNTKANSEHNIGTASTPVLSSKVSFQSLTSPPKTVSESLMRNAMSEHNTVAYSLSNSTSNGANASLQSPDLKFKETSEFEIKDSKPVGTPSTTTLTSLKVSNASLQSLALHAKVLTDSKLGFTKPKDVLDFNSSFSPKTIVAEITSQPSSTSQPNLPTVVSNASEPITQQQSPYKEQQDPLPNKHSRSYSHQPVSPPRKPLVASQNPTRLDDRQTVLDTEHEPVHARATSAVAAPATSNSRYTGVRARQEMLLMYAFSGGSVGDAGLPGGVARARMFRAEATGETESSGLLGVAEVGKDDWRRSVGAVKSSSSAPVTNSVSTMNEEVVDDDLEGEQVEQMGMNKPVRKLVFQNVLQQTGRYAKEFNPSLPHALLLLHRAPHI